jgi:hypothetical protein
MFTAERTPLKNDAAVVVCAPTAKGCEAVDKVVAGIDPESNGDPFAVTVIRFPPEKEALIKFDPTGNVAVVVNDCCPPPSAASVTDTVPFVSNTIVKLLPAPPSPCEKIR